MTKAQSLIGEPHLSRQKEKAIGLSGLLTKQNAVIVLENIRLKCQKKPTHR